MSRAVRDTGLAEGMTDMAGYTLLIPTDDVIARLPERLQNAMATDPEVLLQVLTAQMVNGVYSASELAGLGSVITIGEVKLEIGRRGRKTTVSDSDIAVENLFGRGFVVHIVSGIIVPPVRF